MTAVKGDDATIVVAGDAIITQRLATVQDDGLDAVVEDVRAADVAAVNLETVVHDFEGYPRENHGDIYLRSPPWVLDELSWAGFDMVAAASNHTADYTHGGMAATMDALESRDLPYAGLGRNLAAAREPAYLETSAGRVALIAACSTVPPGATAGAQRRDMQGRPGLAPLELSATYEVPADDLDRLRELSAGLGFEAIKQRRDSLGFSPPWGGFADRAGFTLLNVTGNTHVDFVAGDEYAVHLEADPADVRELTRAIDRATREADWVIASVHAHEGAGGSDTDDTVPAFLEEVARACVDAGANLVFGHGPHLLRGIEVYDGAPVFYSLGNVFAQLETIQRFPAAAYDQVGLDDDADPPDYVDAYGFQRSGEATGFLSDRRFYESVLPVCRYTDGLDRIELVPLDLGFDRSRPHRGRPRRADREHGEAIIARLADLAAPYGTVVRFEDGIGIVDAA